MIRILIIGIFLVFYFLISILTWGVLYFVEKKNPDLAGRISMAYVKFAFRVILFLSGTKIHVHGVENIPKDKSVVYTANHRGIFDILVTYIYMPRVTGFIAKKEVEKVPLLRTWMRKIKCLFLDRKDLKAGMKTILTGVKQIKAGHSMYICPEGTRNATEELLPFKNGSFVLASKSGSPVVPVAIMGTEKIFEEYRFFGVQKAEVFVTFGKPFYIADLAEEDQENIGAYTRGVVQQLLAKM